MHRGFSTADSLLRCPQYWDLKFSSDLPWDGKDSTVVRILGVIPGCLPGGWNQEIDWGLKPRPCNVVSWYSGSMLTARQNAYS